MAEAGEGPSIYETAAVRVVVGPGAVAGAAGELERLGVARALVITTPGRAAAFAEALSALGERAAGVLALARLHVPAEVVREAVDEVRRLAPDGLVALGGGSAVGLAKAVALETGLPILAVPTTYSGSEMTRIWGVREGERKRTGRDARVAPRTVVYDPVLTVGLPAATSAESGMNAVAHAVEALYAPDATPVSSALAGEAIRLLSGGLADVVRRPGDVEARGRALWGAHLAGRALDLTAMGLHHNLAHVLGGTFGLPHARVHALLLPHVTAYNAPAAPEAMRRVRAALGSGDAARGLFELGASLGIAGSLADMGLARGDLERAAELAVEGGYPNPRRSTVKEVRRLLEGAWRGGAPGRGP